ncbi:MAG: PEP-CTERM sorting domain-containing protein, partial [Terracidiphilus sp.]
LASAMALAIAPAALADQIGFSASGYGATTSQEITLGLLDGVTGVYNIAAISGTFGDPGIGVPDNTPITGLYADQGPLSVTCYDGCGETYLSKDEKWDYDNLVFLPGNGAGVPLLFDGWGGELFTVDYDGNIYEVNVAAVDGGLQLWASLGGTYVVNGATGVPISASPEPGSLLLLGTGLFGLAFVLYRKAGKRRQPVVNP